MVLPLARKRARSDVGDEFDMASQPMEKRSRASVGSESIYALGQPRGLSNDTPTYSARTNTGENDSPKSTTSEAGSPADVDMDSDDASQDFRMAFSQSPDQTSSWSLRATPIRPGIRTFNDGPSSRVPTPIVRDLVRPRPGPLQTTFSPSASSASSRTTVSNHTPRSNGVSAFGDRLPSPVDEDEPHTPTTVAGSQLSLLTVSDMEVDVEPPEPAPDIVMVRKQRQRSGAFISTPEARKLSMGYREDCDKCRRRVPGHMNHFLDQ